METLKYVLFENPLYAFIALAIAEIVLAALWWDRRAEKVGRKFLLSMIVPPVLAGVVLMLSVLVVTDREQITIAAREIAADIAADRSGALEKYLDNHFVGHLGGRNYNRTEALTIAKQQRREYGISNITITSATVEMQGETATMDVMTSLTAEEKSLNVQFQGHVEFPLTWVKRSEGWRILECQEPKAQQ